MEFICTQNKKERLGRYGDDDVCVGGGGGMVMTEDDDMSTTSILTKNVCVLFYQVFCAQGERKND